MPSVEGVDDNVPLRGYGVFGSSDKGHGVRGWSNSSFGVHARSMSGYGVYTQSGSGTDCDGVQGISSARGRSGVYGESTYGSGVYGRSIYGYSAYLDGNVHVRGNLSVEGYVSKGSGSFKIDHPLDP